jgi:gentisate 1,2-dioxygenase
MTALSSQVSARLAGAMSKARVQPLWLLYRQLGSLQPDRMEAAMLWPWSDIQRAVDCAAEEVSMDDAERRALILSNPAFAPHIQTTSNLIAAVQILNPGDRADNHRHTMAAIRMIVEADGGFTSVDGQQYEMSRGDLILTPAWTWHAHANDTPRRIVWVDGLDVPLVRNSLDAAFFEPHAPDDVFTQMPHPADRWRWAERGIAPAQGVANPVSHSPRMHYPWKTTAEALNRMPATADGSVTMHYVNPQTGGAIMPTIDCFMVRLFAGNPRWARRSTSNAVCVVLDGEGESTIGQQTLHWRRHDVFTVPHWTWASHCSHSERTHLFMMTDQELFRRLDLLREECAPQAVPVSA